MGLYRQMVGRVLRAAPGKTDALVLDHAGAIFTHGFVDEPVQWTLAQDRRAENPVQTSRSLHRAPTLTTCPECTAVRLQGRACSQCGWQPRPRPQAIEVVDGELGQVDRQRKVQGTTATAAEKLEFYRQLLWIAQERRYKPGWAAHKFKEKFRTWPTVRDVEPMVPEQATRSWVRSRQIAYAKALERAAS
jgi:DNA or RNA helicases of superfamily II